MHSDVSQAVGVFRGVAAKFQGVVIVVHPSNLRRNGDTFAILCPHFSEQLQGFSGISAHARVNQVAANHHARAALKPVITRV